MAQLVLGIAGAAVGSMFGMPQLGFALGSMVGSSLGPSQKVEGPRLADLKAPSATYGTPITYVEGTPRLAGCIAWASDKREMATTTEQGGKGGPSVESTTYTYEIDVLILLTINEIAGIRRIWKNGELIWSAAADADDATLAASMGTTTPDQGDAVQATGQTDHWRELRIYGGGATQMPDPTYEAAVGAGNAPAYRGRGTVLIEGLQLGGSGQMPVLTFEVVSDGAISTNDNVILDAPFTADANDIINPAASVSLDSGVTVDIDSAALIAHRPAGARAVATYSGTKLAGSGSATRITIFVEAEAVAVNQTGGTGDAIRFLTWDQAAGTDISVAFRVVAGVPCVYTLIGATAVQHGQPISSEYRITVDTDAATVSIYNGDTLLQTAAWAGTYGPDQIIVGLANGALANSVTRASFGRLLLYEGDFPADTQQIIVTPVTLDDVVERLCERAGLASGDLDASALASIDVRAMAVSQVTPTRQVLEMLAQAYLHEYVESDKLRAVLRGGASVATIPFVDLGASSGEPGEPLPLRRVNDIELAAQVTVKFANTLNDFQDGAESGDRLVTDSTAVSVIELPLGMTPTEARRLADVATMDIAASMIAIGPIALTREYAALEPTDVVTLTGEQGSTFRARILKASDAAGVRTLELTLDDATAINSAAATDSSYTSSSLVRALVDTELLLLDIPILRDADNASGFYAAFGADGKWRGAALMRSVDDVEYSEVLRATDRAVLGFATSVLPDWSGGNVFDESSRVIVDVGSGTLSSATRDQIINDRSRNALLIGDEILQYRDADLQSTGVYTLTGFLRGRRGTEWAMGAHAVGDCVVLLRTTGLRRVAHEQSEIGVLRYWKAPAFGKSLAGAETQEFTDSGVALKPFSPVDLRSAEMAAGGVEVTWKRRTRLSTRFTGTAGISVPLGEAIEAYDVELRDASDVLVSSATVDGPEWSFAGAELKITLVYGVRAMAKVGGSFVGVSIEGAAYAGKYLRKLSVTTGALEASSFYLGEEVAALVATGADLYVAASSVSPYYPRPYTGSTVYRIGASDLSTPLASYTATADGDAQGLAFDGASLWLAERYTGQLVKLNVSTLASEATHAVSVGITALAHDAGSLYICDADADELVKWDIATESAVWRVSCAADPGDVLVVGSLVFVAGSAAVTVHDTSDGAVAHTVPASYYGALPRQGSGVVKAGDVVLISSGAAMLSAATGEFQGITGLSPAELSGADGARFFTASSPTGNFNDYRTYGNEFTGPLAGYSVTVYQTSATVGRGYPTSITL